MFYLHASSGPFLCITFLQTTTVKNMTLKHNIRKQHTLFNKHLLLAVRSISILHYTVVCPIQRYFFIIHFHASIQCIFLDFVFALE